MDGPTTVIASRRVPLQRALEARLGMLESHAPDVHLDSAIGSGVRKNVRKNE